MTPLLSDLRLARQASAGDQRAFAAIYERYHQEIYRFCLSILGRPEDAQDALQNTMVKALRALPGEQRKIKLRPWLYRVAHNESIDLLRRRREVAELDDAQAGTGPGIADTVAQRERLGQLLADLGELPERQRSALVMRELADLGYEQIGAAFESSAAVARQTVYEARVGLRELEAGREMSCADVTRQLSEADGRVMRRRGLRAHLRACPECRAFRDSIEGRRRDLQALTPLPAAAAASILHGLLGGNLAGSGGLGGAAAAAGTGAGKAAGTSVVVKALATAAVVATVGVTAADRSGLIDAGLPGGDRGSGKSAPAGSGGGAGTSTGVTRGSATANGAGGPAGSRSQNGHTGARLTHRTRAGSGSPSSGTSAPATTPTEAAGKGDQARGHGRGSPSEAARHGQETAAKHKATGRGKTRDHPAHPAHPSPPPSSKGATKGEEANGKAKGNGQEAQPEPDKAPAPQGSESPAEANGEAGTEAGAENGKGKTAESEPSS